MNLSSTFQSLPISSLKKFQFKTLVVHILYYLSLLKTSKKSFHPKAPISLKNILIQPIFKCENSSCFSTIDFCSDLCPLGSIEGEKGRGLFGLLHIGCNIHYSVTYMQYLRDYSMQGLLPIFYLVTD